MSGGGRGDISVPGNTSTRNSLSTGRTSGGRDRRPERCSTRGVRSWGSTSLGTEGCRGGKEESGQRREIWAQGGDTESSQGYINPEELGKAGWAGREQPRKYPV